METNEVNLEPRYSSYEVPGKCIKCLAEHELNECLRDLLREEDDDKKKQEKFEMLIAFLKSPESLELINESERLLADGKQVKIKVHTIDGKIKWEMEVI